MVKFGRLTNTFREGAQAYVDGRTVKSNPYKYGDENWEDWKDGFQFCKTVDTCLHLINEADKVVEVASVDKMKGS